MKIESQPLEDHQIKLTVEVDPQAFDQAKRRAARQLSRRTKIPGFRPGKAPYNIVQRHLGEERILDESLDILLKDLYPQIIDDAGVEPHGPGKLENIVSVDPLKLEFIVPLAAEVELGDYRAIRIPYEPVEVTDEDVDEVLQDLRHRQAVEEPVERPAQEGDHIFVRLSAERAIVGEGDEASLIGERPHSVVIAKDSDKREDEWPFPGFSRELIGMSSGDEKSLSHTFSEESDFESLRGVTAQFNVVVEEVKSRTLPELDDEFAQSIGEYENLAELQQDIRETLERQKQESYDEEYDDEILSKIVEDSSIKYSPQMLDEEIDDVSHQLEHRLQNQNLDLNTYLMTREMNEDDLREELKPVAERRLKRTLVLLEIADQENIEVAPEEVQTEAERTLDALSRTLSDEEMEKIANDQFVPKLVANIMIDMKVNRTLEHIRKIARGDFREEEPEDATEAPDQASAEREPEAPPPEDTSDVGTVDDIHVSSLEEIEEKSPQEGSELEPEKESSED